MNQNLWTPWTSWTMTISWKMPAAVMMNWTRRMKVTPRSARLTSEDGHPYTYFRIRELLLTSTLFGTVTGGEILIQLDADGVLIFKPSSKFASVLFFIRDFLFRKFFIYWIVSDLVQSVKNVGSSWLKAYHLAQIFLDLFDSERIISVDLSGSKRITRSDLFDSTRITAWIFWDLFDSTRITSLDHSVSL